MLHAQGVKKKSSEFFNVAVNLKKMSSTTRILANAFKIINEISVKLLIGYSHDLFNQCKSDHVRSR